MVCTTCAFPSIPKEEKKHIPLNDAQFAIDFLAKHGVKMIAITGGEPLMHPEFLDICNYITKKDIMISYISTNGILLTNKLAKELSKMNINIIGLSIDMLDRNGYGITRKMNIRKTVPKILKTLKKYDIDTYAGIVLGKHTENIKEVIKITKALGFNRIIFSYPQWEMKSSYLAARDIKELKCNKVFWNKLINKILQEKRWNLFVDIFNTRINLNELQNFYEGKKYSFDCPGGREQFYLDWNLNLYRCLNSDICYGNLRKLENLDCEYTQCHACTQQTHRDYASFYHGFKTVKALENSIRSLDIRRFINILRLKENRMGLKSLFEGYLGGFV